MKPHKILNLTIALALMTVANIALAQSPEVQVMQLNKQAMDDYGNLDIEASQANIKQAEELCIQNNLTGAPLARTYINMGMVQYGGLGDNASAMESFKKALCYDSTVMLDPLNSTPDMEILFTGAKNQVQASGCASIVQTAAPANPGPVAPGPVTPAPATVVNNDVLRHTPVTQQKRLMPIPVFIQTNPSIDVSSVILYYRTVGERIFQQLQMKNNQQAWFAVIGCDVLTTFDPTGIDYYVAVLDSQNQILATAGSEAQPFQISIVNVVTSPPPAVPGEEAPAACQEECPPWNPNCNEADCAKYADLCSDSEPCCSGLACVDGVCEEGAGGGDGETISSGGSGKPIKSHVRLFLNAGTGAGLIGSGDYTKDDFSNKLDNQDINVPVSLALNKLHIRLGAMFALPIEKLEIGFNVRGDLPLSPDYSPIAISAIANVAYRIAGENAEKGFQAFALAGLGWMNIMHRVKFPDCYTPNADETGCAYSDWASANRADSIDKNGFVKSGFLGVELGLDMNYFFVKNFGLNFGAVIDVVFPTFAANLDVQAGIALRF